MDLDCVTCGSWSFVQHACVVCVRVCEVVRRGLFSCVSDVSCGQGAGRMLLVTPSPSDSRCSESGVVVRFLCGCLSVWFFSVLGVEMSINQHAHRVFVLYIEMSSARLCCIVLRTVELVTSVLPFTLIS